MQRLHFESPHLSKCKICWICKKALSRKLVKSILHILALFQKSAVSKKRVWLSKKAFLTYFYKMKVQWEQDRLATLKNVWKGAKEIPALNSIALYFAIFHSSRENVCALGVLAENYFSTSDGETFGDECLCHKEPKTGFRILIAKTGKTPQFCPRSPCTGSAPGCVGRSGGFRSFEISKIWRWFHVQYGKGIISW